MATEEKKNKKVMNCLSLTFILLLTVGLISAITIYSGEPVTIELEKPYAYYSLVGNSSEVVLDVVQNGNNVTITPNKYSVGDSYEIIFFDSEKETITIYQSSGGGGSSRTKIIEKNVTEYVDKEVEVIKIVPGETIVEVEKIVKQTPWLVWVIIIILLIAILYLVFFRKQDIVERRY